MEYHFTEKWREHKVFVIKDPWFIHSQYWDFFFKIVIPFWNSCDVFHYDIKLRVVIQCR